MSRDDIMYVFKLAMSLVGYQHFEGLEIRAERAKAHSIFYNGKLLGLYKDQHHIFKSITGEDIPLDALSYREAGRVIAEAIEN